MGNGSKFCRCATVVAALAVAAPAPALAGPPAPGAEPPVLWGYGVRSCRELTAAVPGPEVPDPAALGGDEYLRYREWLAGLVTGLNLATGSDVLKGAELTAALSRIRTHCLERPDDDFFNASLTLFKALGRSDKPKRPE